MYENDYIVLIWPNGLGKTILLKIISGSINPNSRWVTYPNGDNVSSSSIPMVDTYDRSFFDNYQ